MISIEEIRSLKFVLFYAVAIDQETKICGKGLARIQRYENEAAHMT